MPSDSLPSVLGRIAHAVAETLDLREVFAKVAEATADAIPFDVMSVLRASGTGGFERYAFAGSVSEPLSAFSIDEFSPALRETLGTACRIDDLEPVLDDRFALDRRIRAEGIRSAAAVPIVRGGTVAAIVSVASRRAGAFSAEHEHSLRMIADLVGLALEHERLWSLDVARRRRLDSVDALLPTLQQTLDVRTVFNQVSAVVQPVLGHDRLVLMSLSADRRTVTIDALSGEPVPDLSRTTDISDEYRASLPEHEVVPDLEASDRCERARLLGIRSLLRIRLHLAAGQTGALLFLSKTPGAYTEDDIVVARRIADYVSLALSFGRLAEEERLASEAEDRAERLEQRVAVLRDELASSRGFRRIVGDSKPWTAILKQAAQVAPTETTVLLTGESGTGKEVVARLVHRGSPRSKGPFVAINCAALPEALLESELFGHERGAFTGATASHAGSIEQAAGGVLFLDEVGEMGRPVQAKLLRVLQEREFQRLGATRPQKADVRIVAATNRELTAAIARGEFREDLYYRLHVFEIRLPPLRERPEDVLALAEEFLDELSHVVGRPAAGISQEARDLLLAYAWPGNVRELRNVLERATILCEGGLITAEHLPHELSDAAPHSAASPTHLRPLPPIFDLEAAERDLIVRALEASGNNRSRAARLLGLARPQLYHRLKKYGIA